MTAAVVRGDARSLPLPDASVDLIVTSPPYFGLRDYGYAGQIGSEGTPAEWLEALWACTAEWVRVLKPEGSLFVNLGDKYNAYNGGRGEGTLQRNEIRQAVGRGHGLDVKDARPKSLLGLPWRYAIGCMDRLGLILRAEVIWEKVNGLPESVQDRVRRGHEQLFHFVKQPRYYAAVDEIREPYDLATAKRYAAGYNPRKIDQQRLGIGTKLGGDTYSENPLGKLPSSVWHVEDDTNLVRSVLSAIHTGSLTIDEGERILRGAAWTGLSATGGMWTSPATAGSGPEDSHPRATASSGSTGEPSAHTASATHSPTDSSPSHTSTLTTSAASATASGPSTSKPSPSQRTSSEACSPTQPGTQPKPTASTATSSPTPTPTAHQTASGCAESACEPATAALTGVSEASPPEPPTIWAIPSAPLQVPAYLGVDHFAAFPPALVRPIILGWSPPGVCTACAQGRRPVVDRVTSGHDNSPLSRSHGVNGGMGGHAFNRMKLLGGGDRITGYACACPEPDAPTRPAVVLDPFGGTGTTCLVASAYGRHGITVDLSAAYCRLAAWRVNDPGERARARAMPKPPPVPDGMEPLFTM